MLLHIANLRGSLGRVIIIVLVLIGLFWQIDLACLRKEKRTLVIVIVLVILVLVLAVVQSLPD
jgi:cell division protein FtsW (lipid II flippase)